MSSWCNPTTIPTEILMTSNEILMARPGAPHTHKACASRHWIQGHTNVDVSSSNSFSREASVVFLKRLPPCCNNNSCGSQGARPQSRQPTLMLASCTPLRHAVPNNWMAWNWFCESWQWTTANSLRKAAHTIAMRL